MLSSNFLLCCQFLILHMPLFKSFLGQIVMTRVISHQGSYPIHSNSCRVHLLMGLKSFYWFQLCYQTPVQAATGLFGFQPCPLILVLRYSLLPQICPFHCFHHKTSHRTDTNICYSSPMLITTNIDHVSAHSTFLAYVWTPHGIKVKPRNKAQKAVDWQDLSKSQVSSHITSLHFVLSLMGLLMS